MEGAVALFRAGHRFAVMRGDPPVDVPDLS